jgi:hypothetical protein
MMELPLFIIKDSKDHKNFPCLKMVEIMQFAIAYDGR